MPKLISAALAIGLLAVVVVSPGLGDSLADDGAPVYLTIDPLAQVRFGATGLTLQDDPHGDYDLYGETDLTFGANYGHQLKVHWLDTDYWDHDSKFELVGGGPWFSWGGVWEGKLGLMVDTDNPGEASDLGNHSGADAWDQISVFYDGIRRGTIEVTLFPWSP